MGFLFGRGRNARETYPGAGAGQGGILALQNRAIAPNTALAGFTPGTGDTPSLVAAVPVVRRASGIFVVMGTILMTGPSGDDVFGAVLEAITGPNLTVSGGSVTVDGWVMGTTIPPIIGGTQTAQMPPVAVTDSTCDTGDTLGLVFVGMNPVPLPAGQTSVFGLFLGANTGGHTVEGITVQAAYYELP